MKRREFARTALLSLGGTALLSPSAARASARLLTDSTAGFDAGKVTSGPQEAAPASGTEGLTVRAGTTGVLACSTGRPGPVVVMFSVDGTGKTWSNVTPLFTGESTHYTDFVEVQPGKLLVVYDSVPYGWYNIPFADRKSKNVIYGTFVDVRRG